MSQSRIMSFVEAITNGVVGYVPAIDTQIAVSPWFGIKAARQEHQAARFALDAVSLARGYLLRRLFEAILRASQMSEKLASLVDLICTR